MLAKGFVACIMALTVVSPAAPRWAGAQAQQASKTVLAPTVLKAITVINPSGDNTSLMVTLNQADGLSANMANHGLFVAELRNVGVLGRSVISVGYNSLIWIAGGNVVAGRYHIRFGFSGSAGQTSPTDKLSIHKGQNASDPVLTTCTVTNWMCDVILDWPGGNLDLAAVMQGGPALTFSQITVAPTTFTP